MGSCFGHPDRIPENCTVVEKKDLLDICETGDIVLWAGRGPDSDIIRLWSSSPYWSHIGIVYRNPSPNSNSAHTLLEKADKELPDVMLFESNKGFHPKDRLTYSHKDGVRLSDLNKKLLRYKGYFVALRKLHCSKEQREQLQDKLTDYIINNHNIPYSQSILELGRSAFGLNAYDSPGDSCVELVPDAYIHIGILDADYKRSNNYNLVDFTSEKEDLPYLNKSIYLEEEIYCYVPDHLKKIQERDAYYY